MTVKIVVIMPSYRDIEKDIIKKYNLKIIYLWSRQWVFSFNLWKIKSNQQHFNKCSKSVHCISQSLFIYSEV